MWPDLMTLFAAQGTIPGHSHTYALDEKHVFETGRPARVSGNSAAMLGEGGVSWLSPHFQVRGSLQSAPLSDTYINS